MAVQQPAGGMHTAVQLTFSLEIASMQLTPTFKMSGLQLKPTSKVVSMRLAPSQDPQPPMNLQVTFEVAKIELSGGTIGTIRLAPSAQQKPAVLTSPSFAISGFELVAGAGTAPVQLTPSHQEQASVHLTAAFPNRRDRIFAAFRNRGDRSQLHLEECLHAIAGLGSELDR